MTADFDRGEVPDYVGCIKAAEHHEVVVYEGRNQNLQFLKALKTPSPLPSPPSTSTTSTHTTPISGSEKYQQRLLKERERTTPATPKGPILTPFLKTISSIIQRVPTTQGKRLPQHPAPSTSTSTSTSTSRAEEDEVSKATKATTRKTKADTGQVRAPTLKQAVTAADHMENAFLEYIAILKATKQTNIVKCSNILKAHKYHHEGLLTVRLEEAEATIYNSDTSEVIKGKKMSKHMVAYSATAGIIPLDKDETKRTGKIKFQTPENDPIVVTTQDMVIWLEDIILERAQKLSESGPPENWVVPKLTWVNGVPGCGKTTWIIKNFDSTKDIVATTTTEAKRDLIERITRRTGTDAATKIRTIASILANGVKDQDKAQCSRLLVDEALMNHFGAIVMISRIVEANELLLIGDVNQLHFIDRENLFNITYKSPNLLTNITQELLCTHRCPMDVAYALSQVYNGIYSSSRVIQSLHLETYKGFEIPKTQANTLYLTYTQAEKETLKHQGFGSGKGSKTLTIHEAQGLAYESVILIKCASKRLQLHDSVPHAVVAISRHTGTFFYHTDDSDDAVGNLMKRATTSSAKSILDYNLKMAIHNRDHQTMDRLVNIHLGKASSPET